MESSCALRKLDLLLPEVMGQAKRRGNQEQRIAEARERERAKFPASVTCNSCQVALTKIEPMDVRGMDGMRLAAGAFCEACDSVTWVLDGTPEAFERFADFVEHEYGKAQMGIEFKPPP